MSAINAIVELSTMGKLVLFIAFAVAVFVLCSTPWPMAKQNLNAGREDEDEEGVPVVATGVHFFCEGDACPKCGYGTLRVRTIEPDQDSASIGSIPWNEVSCSCGFATDQQLIN